jgi:hypothetical protein
MLCSFFAQRRSTNVCSGFLAALITWIEYFTTNAVADKTWSAAKILPWSVVEVDMYVIAACFLSYHPLVSWVWSGVKQKSTRLRTMVTAPSDSEGRSWAKIDPERTNQSREEEDWVQLVDKAPNVGSTRAAEAETRIRVERHFTVNNELRKDSDSNIV